MPKSTLLTDLTAQRDTLLQFWDALSDEDRAKPITPEGWRVHDIVGHLSFWEQFTLNCIRDTFKNGRPTPLPAGALDDDLNARAAAQRRGWTWQRVRAEFLNTRNALLHRIDGLTESDLQFYIPSPWVNDPRLITVETMLREDVLAHGAEHYNQLTLSTISHG